MRPWTLLWLGLLVLADCAARPGPDLAGPARAPVRETCPPSENCGGAPQRDSLPVIGAKALVPQAPPRRPGLR